MAGADLASTAGLVAAGLGVAVIPRLTLPLTSFADLAIREIAGPTISRSIFCMGSYDSVLDPASQSLLASVEAILS
ncbi:LysR substrate-binding domain-containing protein [Dietzia maris]|uniref:LysR substrate-binding domain-containing protein n=1 Tax=Dietzia maris TaxID=37915 RepID=UPI00344F1959